MAENAAADNPNANAAEAASSNADENIMQSKPLQMSFADWKKSKEAQAKPEPTKGAQFDGQRNGRRQQNNKNANNNSPQQQQPHVSALGQKHQNRNRNPMIQPLMRPPPMPLPLMSLNFGPCGPPPMMPPRNMNNSGPKRNYKPLQPPPFWEDMVSPQHRPPPMQPPMPKCPSLWNLVPKDKDSKPNKKPNFANKKKFKPNQNNERNPTQNDADTALMPPPAAVQSGTSNSSQSNGAQPPKKVKKKSGTFVLINGQWVQKPEAPLPLGESAPGTKEDRQRQWKEYRQAMKPFKNREFHNWKRTVQRLGKLPRDQLDEKQLERLQKAEEYIGAHKAMLTIKHAERWVPQDNENGSGPSEPKAQVFVRKPVSSFWDKKPEAKDGPRFVAPIKKYFGTGRAIKGGVGDAMPVPAPTSLPAPIANYSTNSESTQPIVGSTSYFTSNYNTATYGQHPFASSSSYYANYHFLKGDAMLAP